MLQLLASESVEYNRRGLIGTNKHVAKVRHISFLWVGLIVDAILTVGAQSGLEY